MKYMLLIYGDEAAYDDITPEDLQAVIAAHGEYSQALVAAGAMVGGAELKPSAMAATVRFDGGQPRVTDGPFAETREHLGGYYIIDVPDLEQALEWARKMPCMQSGGVEVRPLGYEGGE